MKMDATALLHCLRESTSRIIGSETTVALAYSGGLDSSFLEKLALECAEVVCYTAAAEGSTDLRLARDRAVTYPSTTVVSAIGDSDIIPYVLKVGSLLNSDDPTKIAYTIPVYRVIEMSEEQLVLAGNGADELFAGYAKYETSKNPEGDMRNDFQKMLEEASRLQKAAEERGKRIGLPFASPEMVRLSSTISIHDKIGPEGRKLILRAAAREAGVAAFDKPKKAAQYSSGVMKAVDRLAKKEHLSAREWTAKVLASERPRP
jgi:asparagine synthase (glutamine-hydrolysing)